MLNIKSWIFAFTATMFCLLPTAVLAKSDSPVTTSTQSKHLALIYTVKDKDTEAKFNSFVTEKMAELGYKLTNPHRRVNDVYKKLYGRTALDLLSFLPVVNDNVVKPLLNIDPRLAGFNPFNMIIYKKLDEESYHLGHLTAQAILDITGVDEPDVREKYIASFAPLDKALAETFGKEHAGYMNYQHLPMKRTMNFKIAIDPDADIDDYIDEFQENFEDIFAQHEYVIAGFHNYIEDADEEKVLTKYDAFWTYSLCHMKYSSHVFDNEGMRPDASVFAPCTMYMYIPKGSHTLYIGMPLLANVKAALDIKDKMRTDFMDRLDKEIASILEENMDAKLIENINPLRTKVKSAAKAVSKSTTATAAEIKITDKRLAKMYVFDGNIENKYNPFVEKTINKIGFKLTDPHKRVNDHYKEKYGSTNLDILSFMSIANEKVVKPLFNIDPRIAGFNPFNLLIYKKKSEKVSYVGHLTANAILDMLSITDPKVRKAYTKSMDELDALIKKELGGKAKILEAKGYAKDRMMNFEIPFKKGEDIEDVVDEFQERFEGAFEDKDYIIAGYNNFKETEGEDTIPDYDAFWTYSLCHFKFSYTIFDNEGGRPEGGLFAPCTMYMYIRKGDNKIIVGMPKLANWKATLGIEDKVRTDFIAKLDHEIPAIMKSLGATEIENTNPLVAIIPKKQNTQPKKSEKVSATVAKVPEMAAKKPQVKQVKAPKVVTKAPESRAVKAVAKSGKETTENKKASEKVNGYKIQLPEPPKPPKALHVITVGGSDIHYTPRSENKNPIIFSQRRPPDYGESATETHSNDEGSIPGMPVGGRVSTYLHAPFMDEAQVEENLKKAGFKVIAVTPVNKKGTLKTVTFTDDDLLSLAKKKNSGFVGVMRVLINKENNEIAITNPLYFARAYMGDAYDAKTVEKVLTQLDKAFKGLQNSQDKLKFTLLPKYRFMEGMPYYKDMVKVAEGKSAQALLDKLKAKGKKLKFVEQIGPDRYLVGVALGKRTSKFIKKTGYHNAFLLPYPILIEQGEAKIMEPKYYISINYPGLKMSNFMKIATIPDAIINDCQKLFK